ncbi:MAG: ferric reductase-like transmembrane domain-containing protein [bacterium]|nr:ferric reductase-like transmembrane domain-containing protein [bacterium]
MNPTGPVLFAGAMKNKKFVILFILFSFLFWLLQFICQYFFLSDRDIGYSFIRSFSLTGALFISISLFSSAVFKWHPQWAKYWTIRRALGIAGTIFISFHILFVEHIVFQWNLRSVFYSLNPLENPVIFGAIAFPIFFVMGVTSTDWALIKLGGKRWKTIHRFVYLGYYAAIFHYLQMNPVALQNIFGYLLLLLTFLALTGELYWFIRIAGKNRFMTLGAKVGFAIILLYLITAYLVFFRK